MAQNKLTGKDLKAIGYKEGRALGAAVNLAEKHFKGKNKNFKLDMLKRVFSIAELIVSKTQKKSQQPEQPTQESQR